MRLTAIVALRAVLALVSCSSDEPFSETSHTRRKETEWQAHPRKPVPNVFGGSGRKRSLEHGFYEQAGSVPSNATWESVAHYDFLGYRGSVIGNSGHPYSISPSGRFVVIPVTYLVGEERRELKIYDKKRNRFILRKVAGLAIQDFEWSADERSIVVVFDNDQKTRIPLGEFD
ncbi:hypothetical protein N9B65_00130 [Akkermansiaceae bacterium]|nr:hypothetical protein [Akkermansiaceae bacterium]